jgi:rhamnosyltransferase subunit B
MKTILFPTLGSSGDVIPLLNISQALNKRGYQAKLVASPVFQNIASESNVDLIPLGTEQQFNAMLNNPDLWHPTRGFSVIVKQGILPFLRPLFEIIQTFDPKNTLIVSPLLLFASHLTYEKLGFPFVTLQLQPSLLRSAYAPPVLGGFEIPGWYPPSLVRLYYKLLDRSFIDPILAPMINAYRAELGLPAVHRIFDQFLFSPIKNICLFPDWFAPQQTDWPPNICLTGFIGHQSATLPLSAELNSFLSEGDRPLVFTAGTAMRHGNEFFQTAISATQMLGKRAVLVSLQRQPVFENLPKEILYQPYADFSQLLPHASVFIYHGGIGSIAQATAAGVPQLIMPLSQDQPDNAARIRRLGLGDLIKPNQFKPKIVTQKISKLLSDPQIQLNCQKYAAKIDFKESLEKTIRELETCL